MDRVTRSRSSEKTNARRPSSTHKLQKNELRKEQATDMADIPAELAMLIFGNGNLDAVDLARIGTVCRRWRQLSMDESLWVKPFDLHCGDIGLEQGQRSRREVVIEIERGKWKINKEREEMRVRMMNSGRGKRIKDKKIWLTGNLVTLGDPQMLDTTGGIPSLKCVVVGDAQVGKTATIITYTTSKFPSDYIPSCYDQIQCIPKWRGMSVCLSLWDTRGDSEYERLRALCYPQTDVFLILYSIDRPESLERIATQWAPEITKVRTISYKLLSPLLIV
jgi:hypothetical protein